MREKAKKKVWKGFFIIKERKKIQFTRKALDWAKNILVWCCFFSCCNNETNVQEGSENFSLRSLSKWIYSSVCMWSWFDIFVPLMMTHMWISLRHKKNLNQAILRELFHKIFLMLQEVILGKLFDINSSSPLLFS